ncbi:PP2C family protein-serine/threonine phosphatase [Marinobacter sp. SS21]|uniref:PP2C family protein-serine/threonine phosphatase n=1 Tax=Marinobacter sp. SS21 TaxID=2979460 RepID=UPI00232CC11C|nr:PP2C family protein-serine/threonine phosphatase [Marinobacter sp. SS21]MDC0663156.1 PP2C family protein-serine/threonine phosphatase [Marinobacter sp. SS21]
MIALWSATQIQGSRAYQEDRYAVVENNTIQYRGQSYPFDPGLFPSHYSLYVLADGMGGMGHGDEAATAAVEVFVENFINLAQASPEPAQHLRQCLDRANQAIADMVARDPDKAGMGTTLIAVLWDSQNHTVRWLSVGDSLLSLLRGDRLQALNEKHTFQRLADRYAEQGDPAKARELSAFGAALSSAVDGRAIPEVDLPDQPLAMASGDLIILASDGLETLSTEQVRSTLTAVTAQWSQATDLDDATALLIAGREALLERLRMAQAPHQDNCTVVLIGWLAPPPASSA